MPWTEQQTRYLLSSGSPLSASKKNKMKAELRANPSFAHKEPGPDANAESRARYRSFRAKESR